MATTPAAVEAPRDGEYVAIAWVMSRYAISAPTVWRWVKQSILPPPIKIGPNTSRWDRNSLLAFERARAEATK